MASAKPATVPDGSALGRSLTQKAVPLVPRLSATSPGSQTETERGGHVVARARPDDHPLPLPRRLGRRPGPRGASRSHGIGVVDQGEQVVAVALLAGDHQPVPDASPRSVVTAPVSWAVSQSWGSSTRATRRNTSGSQRRSHAELGDREAGDRDAAARRRPRLGAERGDERLGVGRRLGVVPELRRAQHRRRPRRARRGRAAGRRPRSPPGGCAPSTPASAHAASKASAHVPRVLLAAGRGGRRVRGPPGGDELAGVGVADLDLARRRRRVDAGHQRHQRTPRSSSVTSWSRRSWP